MPVHAWLRATAGTCHDFPNAWITELRNALNGGVLPEGYYALGAQRLGDVSPDVLTLHAETVPSSWPSDTASDARGMLAVAEHPPKVALTLEAATAYVDPLRVGCTLPAMPLFLTPDHYVYMPLEETYMAAWRGVPQRWRRVIEA